MPRYLLDTNICIYIKNHRPAEVLARFTKLPHGKVAISAITYGELCFGAEKSSKPKETRHILQQLIGLIPVLPLDETVSTHYGKIRQHLQARGNPIGNNDLWIASHALAHKLILVTNNVAKLGGIKRGQRHGALVLLPPYGLRKLGKSYAYRLAS